MAISVYQKRPPSDLVRKIHSFGEGFLRSEAVKREGKDVFERGSIDWSSISSSQGHFQEGNSTLSRSIVAPNIVADISAHAKVSNGKGKMGKRGGTHRTPTSKTATYPLPPFHQPVFFMRSALTFAF
jgi:hypothetical protein